MMISLSSPKDIVSSFLKLELFVGAKTRVGWLYDMFSRFDSGLFIFQFIDGMNKSIKN